MCRARTHSGAHLSKRRLELLDAAIQLGLRMAAKLGFRSRCGRWSRGRAFSFCLGVALLKIRVPPINVKRLGPLYGVGPVLQHRLLLLLRMLFFLLSQVELQLSILELALNLYKIIL